MLESVTGFAKPLSPIGRESDGGGCDGNVIKDAFRQSQPLNEVIM